MGISGGAAEETGMRRAQCIPWTAAGRRCQSGRSVRAVRLGERKPAALPVRPGLVLCFVRSWCCSRGKTLLQIFLRKISNCFHSQIRVQRHPFERIATPFQVYSWTAPQAEHAMDCVRAEDAYTSRLGYEEHIPGQVALSLWVGTLAIGCHPSRWEPADFTDK